MFDVFKLGATYGDIEVKLPIKYEKLCFPFISHRFCRLLFGSAVAIVLHKSVQSGTPIILFAHATSQLIL